MADNVAITAGSGTSVATDDVGSVQYQRIKLTPGPDGTATVDVGGRTVDGGSTNSALYTDPRPKVVTIVQTPTVSTSPAYTAKDAVGGLLTFANAVRASGGTGTLIAVQVADASQQNKDLDLILFNATFTAPTDNAIFAPSDAESLKIIGCIPITAGSYFDFSTNAVADITAGLPRPFVLAGTSLFGALVARGTPTYVATTDIVVTLTIQQD